MDRLSSVLNEAMGTNTDGVSNVVLLTMGIVVVLIAILSLFAIGVSVYLAISYIKYNRTKNSIEKTGEEVARKVLDNNGLQHIRVSKNGSLLFGNSYSHFFKKVRLRRFTWKKKSISSLAMATQKSSLAILDKEGDADMKLRISMTPFIYFGPIAFIPIVLIGVILDILIFNSSGILTVILSIIGLFFYIVSFVMSVMVLKTEKKAQKKAVEIMKNEGLATEKEIEMVKNLFRLYNIEYINDMILALLELIYRVLQIVADVQKQNFSSGSKD